jgi:hypothetical protein
MPNPCDQPPPPLSAYQRSRTLRQELAEQEGEGEGDGGAVHRQLQQGDGPGVGEGGGGRVEGNLPGVGEVLPSLQATVGPLQPAVLAGPRLPYVPQAGQGGLQAAGSQQEAEGGLLVPRPAGGRAGQLEGGRYLSIFSGEGDIGGVGASR